MFTVKRIAAETVLEETEVNVGMIKTTGLKSANRASYAVVDATGTIVKSNGLYNIFPRKSTAEQAAAYFNQKAS